MEFSLDIDWFLATAAFPRLDTVYQEKLYEIRTTGGYVFTNVILRQNVRSVLDQRGHRILDMCLKSMSLWVLRTTFLGGAFSSEDASYQNIAS